MWCQVQATSALTGAGCPLVRSKHAMCTTADGHIYLYGGRSMANKPLRDLWRFDTAQDVWEEVVPRVDGVQTPQCCGRGAPSAQSSNSYSSSSSSSSSSSASSSAENSPNSGNALAENKYEPPPALQEHTIVAARNKLYLFGGQVGFSSDETPLWIFDLATARWSKFGGGVTHRTSNGGRNRSSPRGCSSVTAQPLGRRAHSAVLYHRAGVMSVYGGYQDFKGSSSELWTFHLERQEWTQEGDRYQKSATPPGRHNHSAVVYKDAMYVYGGMTDLQLRSDFWSWSYKTKKWSRIKTLKNPGELCCHSAIVVADSMFIYGGERGEGQAIAELWRYRFESSTWQQVTVQGMLPGCRTRHAAVAIPFFNFNFNNNNNNSSDCYDHNQEEETSFIISQHHQHQHHQHHQQHCISPTTTTASQTTQQKDEQTQVEFDFELQPKKSISLCFEQQQQDSHSGIPMSPAEAEPKKKLIRSSKSSSFRRLRSGRDTGAAAKSQPQPSILMTTSLPPPSHSSTQLSTDEGDLITSEETATTGGGDNSSTTTDGGEHQHQTTLENNQNLLNQKLVSVDVSAEKTAVRMRPRRPLLTRQRPYSDFYAAGHNRNPHHHQEEFESVNEQLTEKQLKRRSVQESMSYYSLCFPTPPARVAKHRENGDKQQTIEEKDDSKKETVNTSSETLINPQQQQQQQSSSEVVMRDNSSLKRRMRKANLQLRDLQQNSFSSQSQQSQPPPPTAFTNPAYYSLSLDISPDFEKELPPPPSCHDSMASPINDSDDNDEDDDDDEQLYSFESSEHDPNPHNFQQPQRPQRATTATTTDLDLLEDYLEPEEMLEIVTSTDSLDGDDVSPTLKMRTIAKYHQTPAHKMSSSSSSQQQPLITSNSSNLPPQPPQRKHRTHRAPSVSHSSSGYQSLVLVDGMATTASYDFTSNPSLSNSSSFADHHQSAVTTITSSSSSSASTNQHSSNLDNLARSITLNLRSRTAAQQQQQQQRNSFELQELRSPLEQEVVVSRKDGQNTSTSSGHHHRSRSLERSNSSSVEVGGKHHRNAHHHHHNNKPHWQPNITEVIREVIVPRSPALINQTESRSTTYDSFRNKKSSSSSRPLVSAFVGRGGRHNGVDNNGVHESWQLCMYVFGGRDGSTGGSVLLNKQPITIWKLYI